MTDLMPCPFCGGNNAEEVGPSLGCSKWRIICDDCGAEGPAHGTEQASADYVPVEAIKAWNARAADPLMDKLMNALSTSVGYMMNARIDLETGCTKATAINTISGGIQLARNALDAAASLRALSSQMGEGS